MLLCIITCKFIFYFTMFIISISVFHEKFCCHWPSKAHWQDYALCEGGGSGLVHSPIVPKHIQRSLFALELNPAMADSSTVCIFLWLSLGGGRRRRQALIKGGGRACRTRAPVPSLKATSSLCLSLVYFPRPALVLFCLPPSAVLRRR